VRFPKLEDSPLDVVANKNDPLAHIRQNGELADTSGSVFVRLFVSLRRFHAFVHLVCRLNTPYIVQSARCFLSTLANLRFLCDLWANEGTPRRTLNGTRNCCAVAFRHVAAEYVSRKGTAQTWRRCALVPSGRAQDSGGGLPRRRTTSTKYRANAKERPRAKTGYKPVLKADSSSAEVALK